MSLEESTGNEVVLEEAMFLSMLRRCITSFEVLDMTNFVVTLTSPIKLARSESIHIKNGVIIGECHSIFSMGTDRNNGPPALILDGTILTHTLTSPDARNIGAAVFVMGKARVEMTNVVIESVGGFGLWVKHKGNAVLKNVQIRSAGRSNVVAFNDGEITVTDSILSHAVVHGVCVRGRARLTLTRCRIHHSGMRAAFVYEQGSLSLVDCHISDTCNPSTPAIQAESLNETDSSSLIMRNCIVENNAGASLVINGKVVHDITEGNVFSEDGVVEIHPDVDHNTVPRPWSGLQQELTAHA